MILNRQLSPGQQLRQEEIADRLGLSRSPLREALRTLESEGLVRHSANQGYFVASLKRDELQQIYLMRRLLETEVLRRSAANASVEAVEELRAINRTISKAVEEESLGDILTANREFHFCLFRYSGLDLVVQQIERLWHLSEAYRATYLWVPETRRRILDEHESMIDFIARSDVDRLLETADAHRQGAEEAVSGLLPE
jgi:DNA-binding GntR family transcriptional regulator